LRECRENRAAIFAVAMAEDINTALRKAIIVQGDEYVYLAINYIGTRGNSRREMLRLLRIKLAEDGIRLKCARGDTLFKAYLGRYRAPKST